MIINIFHKIIFIFHSFYNMKFDPLTSQKNNCVLILPKRSHATISIWKRFIKEKLNFYSIGHDLNLIQIYIGLIWKKKNIRNLKLVPKLAQVKILTYFLTNPITLRLWIDKKETIYAGHCFFFPQTNFVFFWKKIGKFLNFFFIFLV
jgi:hypothetical protein